MMNAISLGSAVVQSVNAEGARKDNSCGNGRILLEGPQLVLMLLPSVTSLLTLEARNHGKAWRLHPSSFLRMSKVSVLRLGVSIRRSLGGDTVLEIKRHRKKHPRHA